MVAKCYIIKEMHGRDITILIVLDTHTYCGIPNAPQSWAKAMPNSEKIESALVLGGLPVL